MKRVASLNPAQFCAVFVLVAVPSEYYSVRKRPEYGRYQETTSMFFPWLPKE